MPKMLLRIPMNVPVKVQKLINNFFCLYHIPFLHLWDADPETVVLHFSPGCLSHSTVGAHALEVFP